MPNTLNLIEQIRRQVPHHTDYAVAKALEMQQSHLARVMAGKAGLGTKAAVRVSELLQRDLRDVIILIEEDKAKTAKDRAFWERRSPRITAAVATAFMALAATLGMGIFRDVNAATTVHQCSGRFTDLYIIRSLKRCLTYLKGCIFPTIACLSPR
jgi:hypothetical protein